MIVVPGIYTILFMLLLTAGYREELKRYYMLFKFLNSLGFIGTAVWAVTISGDWQYFFLLLPGLICCLAGDVLLAAKGNKHVKICFLAGLISFLTGHIVFLYAFYQYSPFQWSDLIFPVIMMAGTYLLTRLPDMDMQGATIPVLIYAFFVSMLMAKAISMAGAYSAAPRYTMLMSGTILFWFSDALILFIIFYKRKYKWSRFINLFTYYYGMFLIAASISF